MLECFQADFVPNLIEQLGRLTKKNLLTGIAFYLGCDNFARINENKSVL